MLKKIGLLFLLIFIIKSNIDACSKCCETDDDRNNKALVNDILKIKSNGMSREQFSAILLTLDSFMVIFKKPWVDLGTASDDLATKIIQNHSNPSDLLVAYTENLTVGTLSFDKVLKAVKNARESESIPKESKCVIL